MISFTIITILTVLLAVAYASFFEWTLHQYVMHRPIGKFRYPFERHALLHHTIFKADATYHLHSETDKYTIPMAWWNGPVLIAVSLVPFGIVSWLCHTAAIIVAAALVIAAYYGAYEYFHWCMHLPKKRRIERTGFFFRLNGHHVLHHRYPHKNFNVVLPFADWCFGTLLLRSKIRFTQARGEMIPDLQPQ